MVHEVIRMFRLNILRLPTAFHSGNVLLQNLYRKSFSFKARDQAAMESSYAEERKKLYQAIIEDPTGNKSQEWYTKNAELYEQVLM